MKMNCLKLLVVLLTTCLCTVRVRGDEEDSKAFLTQVATCANVELKLDTCLVETSVALMKEATDYASNTYSTEQESNNNNCGKPDIDDDIIHYFTNEAAMICSNEKGVRVSAEEIEHAIAAFSTLFSDDHHQCWETACHYPPENDDGHDHSGDGSYSDDDSKDVKAFLTQVATCANVELKLDTCLVETSVALMKEATDYASNTYSTEQESNNNNCGKPDIDDDIIHYFTNEAAMICSNEKGVRVSAEEIEHAIAAFSTLFSDDHHQCWETACHYPPENDDGHDHSGDHSGDGSYSDDDSKDVKAFLTQVATCA
eukprot:CAMPEP_0178513914 /NCGR_PEP_ID=MMETSP0696-20121128/23739_1 /TAXON_ID=265572 /ORGANISM="Extubocellulus spinifer, Strain CCMP396" /LENGTH=312 /DNA_ID=CAMNT_0020143965 /DNA_START=377 /DNA_END=1311 /DNA_ORIENTATION=-